MKVSTCVDCVTPIIGARPRCAACHDRHTTTTVSDDDLTMPRPRTATDDGLPHFLARWILVLELLCVITLALVFGVRGCAP